MATDTLYSIHNRPGVYHHTRAHLHRFPHPTTRWKALPYKFLSLTNRGLPLLAHATDTVFMPKKVETPLENAAADSRMHCPVMR